MAVCQVRPEYEGTSSPVRHPHRGRVRPYAFQADSQPPGAGNFTLTAVVYVCEGHRECFGEQWSHSNVRMVTQGQLKRDG